MIEEPKRGAANAGDQGAPAPQRRPGARRTGAGPAKKSPRRRSREAALQGLYEWLLGGSDGGVIDAHMRELEAYAGCDTAHFDALLHGCIAEAADLDAVLARHVDRATKDLSPVEHAILMLGAYELKHCIDIPYKVAINEAVELAKSYGGTDGHRYVNGVLDKVAGDLRQVEVAAAQSNRGAQRR